MKKTPAEKLSDYLTEIDGNLLDSTFAVDDAKKLNKYAQPPRDMPFYQRPVFRGTLLATACLAIIIGTFLAIPMIGKPQGDIQIEAPPGTSEIEHYTPTQPDEPSIPQEVIPPWERIDLNSLTIENADMLNYYSAIRLLAEQAGTTQTALPQVNTSEYTFHPLLTPIVPPPDTTEETTEPANTEGPPIGNSTTPSNPDDEESIYYYEFDPRAKFHVSQVAFFQIELTGEGFLASKLGCGIVDVVITNISVDPMITFKNGDNYYSCLLNGGGPGNARFSTHKYIEGFRIVKNFQSESYLFLVDFNSDKQAVHFECSPFDAGSKPDGVLKIVSQTYISEVNTSFTIAELEKYFSKDTLPPQMIES